MFLATSLQTGLKSQGMPADCLISRHVRADIVKIIVEGTNILKGSGDFPSTGNRNWLRRCEFLDEAVTRVMKEFDTSNDSHVDVDEFVRGISNWLTKALRSARRTQTKTFLSDFRRGSTASKCICRKPGEIKIVWGHYVVERIENNRCWTSFGAISRLLLGNAISVAFASPLVDTVQNFSRASNIPSFFISFILLPLATNSREAMSALLYVQGKSMRTASLTFSKVYLWGGDLEQHALPAGFLGPCLLQELDMALLIRSADHSHRLHCDWRLRQFPHHLPPLDMFCGIWSIPILPGTGLCTPLCLWVVIDHEEEAEYKALGGFMPASLLEMLRVPCAFNVMYLASSFSLMELMVDVSTNPLCFDDFSPMIMLCMVLIRGSSGLLNFARMDRCPFPLSLPSWSGDRNPEPRARTPEAPSSPSSNASQGKQVMEFSDLPLARRLRREMLEYSTVPAQDLCVACILMDGVCLPEDVQEARSWGDQSLGLRGEGSLFTVSLAISELQDRLRRAHEDHQATIRTSHEEIASALKES
ncbi:hypothetical protein HHK36_005070 [Tetracentron sinense]|uniref:EF-hand domain-containing protein n=1 Tax=Tetracentron sinense TaxID=13715 RepID=A0A834ZKJ5_TETSI|nr:hypothetical protein HHK36_005070 [Tetracentron sinense]